MAAEEEEEKVILEVQGVKHKKQDGILLLTSVRVAWAPGEILQTFQVDYPYQQIKAQRISAESSSKVQLQLVLHNGPHVNFHFTGSSAGEQRRRVKEHLARALSKPSSVQISAELEAKNNLLKNNPNLYQLYKDLVTTGLITPDEFWASHGRTGNSAESAQGQESGLPSAFLADVQAVYDGCNAVKYNLSTDVIHAIFKTYPMVKKKHAEMVPQKYSEEEFWTHFFQSQFFHRESKSQHFADCLSGEQLEGPAPHRISVPETSSELLGEEGYSVVSSECNTGSTSSLLKRCNQHSSRVLEALMEGLAGPEATPTAHTQQHSHLQLSKTQGVEVGVTSSESLRQVAQSLSSWHLQQDFDPAHAHCAVRYLAPGGALTVAGCGQNGSQMLSHEEQQQVFRHQMALAELLRHFWSCFPARTPQLEAKAHKMQQCLIEYKGKQLHEFEQTLDSRESLHSLDHLKQCIEQATQHYHRWTAKKKNTYRTA